jgi:hypothetical protein
METINVDWSRERYDITKWFQLPTAADGLIKIVDFDPTAPPHRIRFRENWDTKKKPTHSGQLFYKDFFNLEPDAELVLHVDGLMKPIQFIGLKIDHWGAQKCWCMTYRNKDGSELSASLHYLGAAKSRPTGGWAVLRWVTLKEQDNDR